ncbi:MAG: aldehyde dehydrogenase (NADP(+)) [Elusimicrobia bacterium CG08_land_8_20_14_0_20_59_10]|nr:MAG: aldehyde dehydrogenase (NADP(+)) [Elusimicrobia bacterium CG08_land_8_20_14_0_20_59_10]
MQTKNLTGKHLIGGKFCGTGGRFRGVDPASGAALEPAFCEAGTSEVNKALELADKAFDFLQTVPVTKIAALLERIAQGLEAEGAAIIARAHQETALPVERLRSELARTAGQARTFAALARGGSWAQARIDHALPGRKPLPKPDIRTVFMGVGPVVVFGASNFPLAISVAGTDTVAAFAARCPVVVKGHPAHPGTCELVARVIAKAIDRAGLPPGMFSMLQASGYEAGLALVNHPLTAAVAFTGSLQGGRALFDAAAARPEPIPVYAEMGSVNPVFILPGAAAAGADKIAEGLVRSLNTGVGQFCTSPGMALAVDGPSFKKLLAAICARAAYIPPAAMLHAGMQAAYDRGTKRLASIPGVKLAGAGAAGAPGAGGTKMASCRIFTADAALLSVRPELSEEVFGPSIIIFRCRDMAQLHDAARRMRGSLTATIHGTKSELLKHGGLVRALQRRAGRILFNGFPTGLEPCASLHHGGPYPATTHSFFTSVGTAAIYRYVRPVCFQGFPDPALPEELRAANPRRLRRLVDGELI